MSTLRTPWLPRLVVAPSFIVSFLFIYGLIAWNGVLSVSASRLRGRPQGARMEVADGYLSVLAEASAST